MARITKEQAISIAQSYATITGRKWAKHYKEVGSLTIDSNSNGLQLVEIVSKTGGERSIIGHYLAKDFYLYISAAKKGIHDYKLSPIFIEHALAKAYNSASTLELKQVVVELVKDNIIQRCKQFIERGEFETFGYDFMKLLSQDSNSKSETEVAIRVYVGFEINIEGNSFSFSHNKELGTFKVTATIPPKETFTWVID